MDSVLLKLRFLITIISEKELAYKSSFFLRTAVEELLMLWGLWARLVDHLGPLVRHGDVKGRDWLEEGLVSVWGRHSGAVRGPSRLSLRLGVRLEGGDGRGTLTCVQA